eukprot:m.14233 g.14233  ORF g.14233 m.14233 type:complete len:238 (-) comp4764_c1_seq1:30-743(-)
MASLHFDPRVLKSTAPLTGQVQSHLVRTYTALGGMLASAAVGAYCNLYIPAFWGAASLLTTFVSLGLVVYLAASRTDRQTPTRIGCALALGFTTGLSVGPLIAMAATVNPSAILSAFVGTSSVFVCFSIAAFMSRGSRTMIFLGGGLSSAVTLLFVSSLLNMFLGSVALFQFQLYFGLVVFSGFVCYDTQLMIEKAQRGDLDYIWHAVDLFIDVMAIFRRLLIILSKKDERRNTRRR